MSIKDEIAIINRHTKKIREIKEELQAESKNCTNCKYSESGKSCDSVACYRGTSSIGIADLWEESK